MYRRELISSPGSHAAAVLIILGLFVCGAAFGQQIPVPNGGFEAGLDRPWGTGQYGGDRAVWWNAGGCRSTAGTDSAVRHGGAFSLHVLNQSVRAPNVYGTTQQEVSVPQGRRVRVTLFAKARSLRSNGAVSIIVDPEWKVRPIELPQGTYDWTSFSGEFETRGQTAHLRILTEDAGEAWVDDIRLDVVEDQHPLPEGLAELAGLATPATGSVIRSVGTGAATIPLERGARIVIPAGALSRPAKLKVTTFELGLERIALDVAHATAYEISTDVDFGTLGVPVVLELPQPTTGSSVLEYVDKRWKRREIAKGAVARAEIHHFSTHLLTHVFWLDYDNVGNRSVRAVEGGDEWTRKFYGVGEVSAKPHDQSCEEIRRVLARYAEKGNRKLPSDSPWTNEQLYDYLLADGVPSGNGGYFFQKVMATQPAINAKVLAAKDPVSPAALLRIAIDLHGGDIPLGILAAQVWTKQLTNEGRRYPSVTSRDVPKKLGQLAGRLETWRCAEDVDPTGTYDKLGPLYHLFSSMTAGVWGGTHFSRFAIAGESMLRSTGLTNDHPDPEKGSADACGASIARWVNDGLPGAEQMVDKNEPPFAPPPPKTVVKGFGRWKLEKAQGSGQTSVTIDLEKGTFKGRLLGWHQRPGEAKFHLDGEISGQIGGRVASARLEGRIDYAETPIVMYGPSPPAGKSSGTFTANYDGGQVTCWATRGDTVYSVTFPVD